MSERWGGRMHPATQKEIVLEVYEVLQECGDNPVGQLVGCILSEDPTYITAQKNARKAVAKIDRNKLLQEVVDYYFTCETERK